MSTQLIRLALAAWAALAALQVVWHGWLHPPARIGTALALGLTLLPLALPLLAWRRGVRRALLWAGIAALGYFAHGVMEAWAAPAVRVLASTQAALATLLIVSLGTAGLIEKRARREL